jgi:hypothetical protein
MAGLDGWNIGEFGWVERRGGKDKRNDNQHGEASLGTSQDDMVSIDEFDIRDD